MSRKFFISLKGQVWNALAADAERDRRDARDQAAVIVERDLERRGLLPEGKPESATKAADARTD